MQAILGWADGFRGRPLGDHSVSPHAIGMGFFVGMSICLQ